MQGITKGITSESDNMKKSLTKLFKSIVSTTKDFFKIKSPSRLFRDEVGTYLSQGIGVGFEYRQ